LHELSGLSFGEAGLSVILTSGERKTTVWPVLLTHFGCSGPAVFVIASYAAFESINFEQPLHIYVQPIASMTEDTRNNLLLHIATTSAKKNIQNVLWVYLPKRFVQSMLGELDIQMQQQVSTLTKHQRTSISKFLWNWIQLTCIKRRPGDEFVTAWWVALDEIDPKTMESRVCPWLYFAGEIMDVDGVTWWYNLQASWAAGRLVGVSL
jgi:predicted Rossmann fold flavoprotein